MERKVKEAGAVLVVVGLSSRMEELKPMLPLGDSTITLHMAVMLKRLGVSPPVAATRYRVGELEERLSYTGVQFVRDERLRETQMFDFVKLGVEAAAKGYGRIMVLPIDTPAIVPDTIRQILMTNGRIIWTIRGGEPRYPTIFQNRIAERLCTYQGEGGLRGIIEGFDGGIMDLEVEDEGIYQDVDAREEYRELVKWSYKRGGGHSITPLVQVRLKAGDVFFEPGIGQPPDMIYQTGSIQEVCCRIGLSCSKGSCMIWEVERQLGIPVVERRTGEVGGGSSSLTDKGKKLMGSYAQMVAGVRQSTEQIFLKYLGKGISS